MEKLKELVKEINNLNSQIDTLKKRKKILENEREQEIIKLIEKEEKK